MTNLPVRSMDRQVCSNCDCPGYDAASPKASSCMACNWSKWHSSPVYSTLVEQDLFMETKAWRVYGFWMILDFWIFGFWDFGIIFFFFFLMWIWKTGVLQVRFEYHDSDSSKFEMIQHDPNKNRGNVKFLPDGKQFPLLMNHDFWEPRFAFLVPGRPL